MTRKASSLCAVELASEQSTSIVHSGGCVLGEAGTGWLSRVTLVSDTSSRQYHQTKA